MKFSGRKELVKYFHHYGPPDVSNTNCGNELSSNTDNYCPFLAVATTPATHSYTGWSMQMPVLLRDWFLILQKMNLEKSTSQFKYVCVLYIEVVQIVLEQIRYQQMWSYCIRMDQIVSERVILYQFGSDCIRMGFIISEWIFSSGWINLY